MPNRILKDSICTSPNIDALSRDAEVFFYRLLVQCDDYGRMDARPAILRAKCYPLQIDKVAQDDVKRWLDELVRARLVVPYSVDGADFLQMRTWERHQQIRAKRSKYPDMIADDINCNHVIADAPVIQSNPIQSENESKPNGGGFNGNGGKYGSQQQHAAYHTIEAQKLGVEPESFRIIVDKLIDAAGWRALVDAGQNERKLTAAKDAALELVRMAVTTPEQVDTLIGAYRTVNDWRKTPPAPQALSEYASQIADKLKPKPKKAVWVLDANGNRMHEAQL